MATQTQRRGGTTQEHTGFVGANRETTIDTDKKTVVVHDGSTQGGYPLAREDLSNVEKDTLMEKLAIDKPDGINLKSLIEQEKEKIQAQLHQKIQSLMAAGQEWSEQIKTSVINNIKERQLLQEVMPLGVVFPYTSNTPPESFLLLNGETLGAETSNAIHAGDDYQLLYAFLWNSLEDDQLVISGNREDNALADWQADKIITLPDLRGRSIIGAGVGTGLSNRILGSTGGSETHTLTTNEMPSHSHSVDAVVFRNNNAGTHLPSGYDHDYVTGTSTSSVGGNAAHNNMSPWLALSWIIKY